MESVDRLRDEMKNKLIHPHSWFAMVDAIEAEVAERYMELPVDKDGVPIHVGDTVYGEDGHGWHVTCLRIGDSYSVAATDGSKSRELRPCWLTHQKPPTVEDVLEEALNKAAMLDRKEGGYWPSAADVTNIVNEYAHKLRLADEGDA